MQEVGIVEEIKGNMALVIVERKNSCSSCPGASLCSTVDGNSGGIEAVNNIGAKKGDKVKIEFRSLTFLKSTIVIYLVPALFLVFGAVIGKNLISPYLPSKDPEAVSAFTAFLLFILSFLVVRLSLKKFLKLQKNTPIIIDIIN